jgi:ABC-type uncharacterized transport system substrate-binding protein
MAQAEPLKVVLIQGEGREAYHAFETALRDALSSNQDVQILSAGTVGKADLLVAIGPQASEGLGNPPIPVLNVMVTRAGLEKSKSAGSRMSSGIYMDQPLVRQVSLIRAALPQAESIGLLFSQVPSEMESLRTITKASGLGLHVGSVPEPSLLASRLLDVLSASDVLLVLPDAAVYRSDTVRNILLESYRQRVPMVGFSQNYVRAGALCAVYSTPSQIADQAARIVTQFARTKVLPEYQYPQDFEVAVNMQVARSLGLTVKSAEQLRKEIGGRP